MDNFLGRNDERLRCRGMLHIVKNGDTLYKIAKQYGVPLSRVMYANPYVDVYNLQIGDEICVPIMAPRPPVCPDGMRPPRPGICPRSMNEIMPENQPDTMAPQMPQNRPDTMAPQMPQNRSDNVAPQMPQSRPDDMAPQMPQSRPDDMAPQMPQNRPDDMAPQMPQSRPDDMVPQMPPMMENGGEAPADYRTAMPWNNPQNNERMLDEYMMGMPRQL